MRVTVFSTQIRLVEGTQPEALWPPHPHWLGMYGPSEYKLSI